MPDHKDALKHALHWMSDVATKLEKRRDNLRGLARRWHETDGKLSAGFEKEADLAQSVAADLRIGIAAVKERRDRPDRSQVEPCDHCDMTGRIVGVCGHCGGTGEQASGARCYTCKGSGEVDDECHHCKGHGELIP